MRALFLSLALGVGALGVMGLAPADAKADPPGGVYLTRYHEGHWQGGSHYRHGSNYYRRGGSYYRPYYGSRYVYPRFSLYYSNPGYVPVYPPGYVPSYSGYSGPVIYSSPGYPYQP